MDGKAVPLCLLEAGDRFFLPHGHYTYELVKFDTIHRRAMCIILPYRVAFYLSTLAPVKFYRRADLRRGKPAGQINLLLSPSNKEYGTKRV